MTTLVINAIRRYVSPIGHIKYFTEACHEGQTVSVDFLPGDLETFRAAGYDTSAWESARRAVKLEDPITVQAQHDNGSVWLLLGVLPMGCSDKDQAILASAAMPDIQPLCPGKLPQTLIVTTYTPADKSYRGNALVVKAVSGAVRYEGKDTSYDGFHDRLTAFGYKLVHEEFPVQHKIYWGGKPMSRTRTHVYDLCDPVPAWLSQRQQIPSCKVFEHCGVMVVTYKQRGWRGEFISPTGEQHAISGYGSRKKTASIARRRIEQGVITS